MPPEARRAKLEGLGRHQGAEGNKMWPEGGIFPMARGHGCDIDIIILAGRYYITGAILDLSSQYAGLYYRPGRILTVLKSNIHRCSTVLSWKICKSQFTK